MNNELTALERKIVNAQQDQKLIERQIDNALDDQELLRSLLCHAGVCQRGPIEPADFLPLHSKRFANILAPALQKSGIAASALQVYGYLLTKSHRPQRGADEVLKVIDGLLSGYPISDGFETAPNVGWLNCHFLNESKASLFGDSYAALVRRCSITGFAETDENGASNVAWRAEREYACATPNHLGQACAILWDPKRYNLVDWNEIEAVADVDGIKQLRPALSVVLQDRPSRFKFRVVAVHLKSMLGGVEATSKVRFHQCQALISELNKMKMPTLLMGDFNCDLTNPLIKSGFKISEPTCNVATQQEGTRIDAFLKGGLAMDYRTSIVPVYRDAWEISDHAALLMPFFARAWSGAAKIA